MATTYYVDPAASGDNNGTNWTHAWTSLQSAADTAVAGDTVYCRGTQVLSATIDFDTQAGDIGVNGLIKFIGCNSEGNVDGTRFTLDGNDQSIHCATLTTACDDVWFENFRFTNTGTGTYHGFYTSGSSSVGLTIINCSFDNCGGTGALMNYVYDSFIFRCVAYSNGSDGFNIGSGNKILMCASHDNGGSGFYGGAGCTFYGCISHGNGDDGFENIGNGTCLINCVIDGNTDDGIAVGSTTATCPVIFGCRITNHSGSGDIGLNCGGEGVITGYNYFEANDGDNIQNATFHYFISIEGGATTTNIEDQSNTNQGYVDPTNHDFSTGYTDSGDPDLRRTAITVPWT